MNVGHAGLDQALKRPHAVNDSGCASDAGDHALHAGLPSDPSRHDP
jgi:hypothetical protein